MRNQNDFSQPRTGLPEEEIPFSGLLALLRNPAGVLPERPGRGPGPDQLRAGRLLARKPLEEGVCEAYACGYALYGAGGRRAVLWLPDCPRAAREGAPDLDEAALGALPWYLAVALAGENRIGETLFRPRAGTVSYGAAPEDRPVLSPARRRPLPSSPGPEEEILRREAWAEALSTLTPPQREAWDLYFGAGLNLRETAALLGVSRNAVASRLAWAERKLRRILQDSR